MQTSDASKEKNRLNIRVRKWYDLFMILQAWLWATVIIPGKKRFYKTPELLLFPPLLQGSCLCCQISKLIMKYKM